MLKKITGWALLIAGLIIIFWVLYSSFKIFTAKTTAPEIFKVTEKKEQLLPEEIKTTPSSPEELQNEMKKIIEEQMKEIIPSEFLTKLLNLLSWSIFTGILIFGGSKISGIGIRLIRED